jgi:hypothetical protein
MEVESLFSEKTTPISELVKGNPDRPLREPALALFACLFNVFQIYQLLTILPQVSVPADPFDPFSFMSYLMAQIISGLVGWYAAFSIILLIGAAIVYYINRRVGGAIILVISIIGILSSFLGVTLTFAYTRSLVTLVIGFLAPVFGLIAGIWAIRSKDLGSSTQTQEII